MTLLLPVPVACAPTLEPQSAFVTGEFVGARTRIRHTRGLTASQDGSTLAELRSDSVAFMNVERR